MEDHEKDDSTEKLVERIGGALANAKDASEKGNRLTDDGWDELHKTVGLYVQDLFLEAVLESERDRSADVTNAHVRRAAAHLKERDKNQNRSMRILSAVGALLGGAATGAAFTHLISGAVNPYFMFVLIFLMLIGVGLTVWGLKD